MATAVSYPNNWEEVSGLDKESVYLSVVDTASQSMWPYSLPMHNEQQCRKSEPAHL